MSELTFQNVDEPKEILHLGYQIIIASLTILFMVPFTISLPISFYEEQSGVPLGSWWYVGLLFIIITAFAMGIFLFIKGVSINVILIKIVTSFVFIFFFGLIINSLWQHGVFIWNGYFQSYQYFFTSDMVISITTGLTVIGFSTFIPMKSKNTYKNILDHCDTDNMCYFPTQNGIKKMSLEQAKQFKF